MACAYVYIYFLFIEIFHRKMLEKINFNQIILSKHPIYQQSRKMKQTEEI